LAANWGTVQLSKKLKMKTGFFNLKMTNATNTMVAIVVAKKK
jgi:hypothetical protein